MSYYCPGVHWSGHSEAVGISLQLALKGAKRLRKLHSVS